MAQDVIYCPSCGSTNGVNSKFCEACGAKLSANLQNSESEMEVKPPKNEVMAAKTNKDLSDVKYADLGDRFIAYILDAILFNIIGRFFGLIFGIPLTQWGLGGDIFRDNWPSIAIGFIYFFLMEYYNNGQTLGKMIVKIRTVDEQNLNRIDAQQAALHTIGKVVFLPLDIIIGLIAKDEDTPQEDNQIRFTQKFSHTSVIKE